MAIIGVVTDDFTGTASAGMLMAKRQVETGLFFDEKQMQEFHNVDQLEAVYVSTSSRNVAPELAYDLVFQAARTLRTMGVRYYSKKIDTTLRGGIGYEVDALLDFLGEDTIAVMVTAMPQSRRVCVGGYSVIDGVLLTETSIARDVKRPVNECYIPDLMRSQTRRQVGWISIRDVKKGIDHLKQSFVDQRAQGSRVIVVDAITMEHVHRIAEACVDLGWHILPVDPGAFTVEMAVCRGIAGETECPEAEAEENGSDGTALFIVGSANPSTGIQIQKLMDHDARNYQVSADPVKLIGGGAERSREVERVLGEIDALMEQPEKPRAIVVETAFHGSLVNLDEQDQMHEYEKGGSSAMINEGLAQITEKVLERYGKERISGLMLTGGDTMECVARKIGVTCIKALDNIVAQVDVGRILGRYEGMPVVVKGGFCGYDEVGIDIVRRLAKECVK